jgi:hypothetical protein
MSQTTPTTVVPLTVVLVHGAFADASSWTGVIERLQVSGVQVTAPDEGERLGEVESGSKDSVLSSALVPLHYPTGQGAYTAVEFAINPAQLRDAFAADLPAEQTAIMAATQRPVAERAFSEPSWVPAWAVVATGDKAAGSDVVRALARRAGAKITEVEGSRVIMLSQPQAVTDVILSAVAVVSKASERPRQ